MTLQGRVDEIKEVTRAKYGMRCIRHLMQLNLVSFAPQVLCKLYVVITHHLRRARLDKQRDCES